ncbi:MAG: hypothetical protein ACI8ZM_000160 [Crocinitomix sp.]|jgi:hypothetical protein
MNRIIITLIFSILSLSSKAQTCEWATAFGGDYIDGSYDLEIDYRNNIICSGIVNNTVDFNPEGSPYVSGSYDYAGFIAKYDQEGLLMWVAEFAQGSPNIRLLTSDEYGNIYAFGSFHEEADFDPGPDIELQTPVGYNDGFLLKLNSEGEFDWVKIFQGITDEPDGLGTGISPRGLEIDVNGNLFLTAGFAGTVDLDPGPGEEIHSAEYDSFFIEKLNSDGELVWLKTIIPPESYGRGARLSDLAVGPFGHVHITGTFRDSVDFDPGVGFAWHSTEGRGAFVMKLDNNGDFHWSNFIEADYFLEIQPMYIEVAHDGSIYTSGDFRDEIDFDPSEEELFLEPTGWISLYIQKLNSSGNFEWCKMLGVDDQGVNVIMEATPSGNLALFGAFRGTIDMDPDEDETYYLETNGGYDLFLADINSDGELVSANSFGGEENEYAREIKMSNSGYFYINGRYRQTVDFDYGPSELIRTTNGGEDIFLVKLGWYLSVEEQVLNETFSVYPNPANNFITISGKTGDALKIIDLTGQIVVEAELNDPLININCDLLASGLYFVTIKRNKSLITQKLIVN